MINQDFKKRRRQLLQAVGPEAIVILPAAREIIRNGDCHYPFRQRSDFYYLTGFNEPEAVLVLAPGCDAGEFILFNRTRNRAKEIWHGPQVGQAGAREHYGADQAFPIEDLKKLLPQLIQGHKQIVYDFGRDHSFDAMLLQCVEHIRRQVRSGINPPDQYISLEQFIHEMRLFKSNEEIDLIRYATSTSVQGHKRAMKFCKPGVMEYQLAAEIQHEFQRNNCESLAYDTIVGGGKNSCILHYIKKNEALKEGDLVLIDAGAEYQNYAADITRTFPVNGHFSEQQKLIYDIVLRAQQAGIDVATAGNRWNAIQAAIVPVITAGLVELGILQGNVEDLIAQKAYQPFYMHKSGHWMGIDVHDVGMYRVNGEWRTLMPGLVFTVEPGIYISANTPHVDEKWWNIGVRIEDDILVTDTGNENLTSALPREIDEIEALMQS